MEKKASAWCLALSLLGLGAVDEGMADDYSAVADSERAAALMQSSEAHQRTGYARSPATGLGISNTVVEPEPQVYVRSAPSAVAALYARQADPSLGAAHEVSLALDLSAELTPAERHALMEHGPWLTDDGLSNNAQQLIRAIQNASVHGLDPDSYSLPQILRTVDTLTHLDKPDTQAGHLKRSVHMPGSDYLRDDLSELMSHAFVRLTTHLGQGVVDARSTQRELYRDVPLVDAVSLLESVSLGQLSVARALDSVTPRHSDYRRLTARMRDLLTERSSGMERIVINGLDELSTSSSHENVMDVKFRLVETGELPLSTVMSDEFDDELDVAVKKFQKRHGLHSSGVIDQSTRKALNLSIDEEIAAIALSLERWRWMPRELGRQHLFVNIPDYRVLFRDGGQTTLSMVAVVGAVDHQTPSFSRDMTYLEFNPTWTVPANIANAELLPKERRQPGYLVSRQFDFLKRVDNTLVEVPAENVTAEDFKRVPFPYVLRQRGGANNALGRMKFMMPNPYAIYLHDTQAKHYFTLNDRAFSHGCIRLSEPDKLATLLMTGDGYKPADISKVLGSTQTSRIRLRSPIPTHLTYLTTWIDEAGDLQRRPDIYGHDAALFIALQASETLLSILNRPSASPARPMLLASEK